MRGHPLGAGPWSGRNSTGGESRPWAPIPGDGQSQERKSTQMNACSQSPRGGNGKTGRFGSGRARGGPPAQQKVIWPPEAGALTGPGPGLLKQHVPEGCRLECESIPDAAGPAGPWRREAGRWAQGLAVTAQRAWAAGTAQPCGWTDAAESHPRRLTGASLRLQ